MQNQTLAKLRKAMTKPASGLDRSADATKGGSRDEQLNVLNQLTDQCHGILSHLVVLSMLVAARTED